VSPRRLLLPLLCAAIGAIAPAAARADVYPSEVIDGPSADLVRLGDVDLARDGGGAVVYLKKDAGVDHVFMSRLFNGAWQAPVRVDPGLTDAASQPVVAASDGGRIAIAFVSGGQLFAIVKPAGVEGVPAPQAVGAPASVPSIDMSINGAGYIVYVSRGDVRAARLDRTATAFQDLGVVLDVDPAQPAGDVPERRPDVAVSADGTAVAVWGERGGDNKGHVYARRLFNSSISTAPQDLTLPDFEGRATGDADSPDADVEDDSSYAWVTFRQAIDGQPRALARRLVGSEFQGPSLVDPAGFPAAEGTETPGIDINGTGGGLVVSSSSASHQVYAAPLADDKFEKGSIRIDGGSNGVAARPLTGVAQSGDGFVSWLQSAGTGQPVALRVRLFDDKTGFAPESPASLPELGSIDQSAGYDAAADRVNDAAVVAIQGTGADRRLVAGMIDRPPGSLVGTTTQKVRRFQGLRWSAPFDLWGPVTYTVMLDDKPAGTTQETNWSPPKGIADGIHRWRVIATDRRGQTNGSATRLVRVDNTAPALVVRVSGTRKARKLLKFRFNAGDVRNVGASGLASIRVQWGDGSRPVQTGKTAAHRYRRGRYTLRVSATDKAGNATVVRRRLVIKK
jgi:hypothetical protein